MLTPQAELTLHSEKLLPEVLRKRWAIATETLEPDRRSNIVMRILSNESTMREIAEKVLATRAGDQRGELHARQVRYILACSAGKIHTCQLGR